MIRTGIGFDAHCFAKDRRLVLGGVEIEYKFGLAGYSDADVLCHAVADALLGAAAEGDIGKHFPDTDPKWKNVSSIDLLKIVAGHIRSVGAHIINIDSTVIAEKPGMSPYISAMRENIAKALNIDVNCVSVKATTVEKMGAIGREEGIAVLAVATIDQEKR